MSWATSGVTRGGLIAMRPQHVVTIHSERSVVTGHVTLTSGRDRSTRSAVGFENMGPQTVREVGAKRFLPG
jgi:hypothetical protein